MNISFHSTTTTFGNLKFLLKKFIELCRKAVMQYVFQKLE
jgi:hypothetical protein